MHLIDEFIVDVPEGLVVVPGALSERLDAMLDAEIAKWPGAESERDSLRSKLLSFYSKYGHLPKFTLCQTEPTPTKET